MCQPTKIRLCKREGLVMANRVKSTPRTIQPLVGSWRLPFVMTPAPSSPTYNATKENAEAPHLQLLMSPWRREITTRAVCPHGLPCQLYPLDYHHSSPRKCVDSARWRLDDGGRRGSRSSRRTPAVLASMEAAADDAPPSPPRKGVDVSYASQCR